MSKSFFRHACLPIRGPVVPRVALVAGVVCAALVVGGVSPAWAGESGGADGGRGAVQLGGFAIGDGLQGLVGEQDGSLHLSLPVGGMTVAWDSRRVGDDRYGLDGWNWNLGHVRVDGGVRVTLASGETFEVAESSPSGLLGYHANDVKFVAGEGRVEARADALGHEGVRAVAPDGGGERAYAYVMHELGGATTYYDAAGDPVVRRSVDGGRVDLIWDDEIAHRLLGVVNPDGVLTRLDWAPDGAVSIIAGANVRSPEPGAPVAGSEWRLVPGPGGLSKIVDPLGGEVRVEANDAGLLTRVSGVSGAVTEASWSSGLDGSARVDTVRTTDGVNGGVLSERTWRGVGERVASGWPASAAAGFGGSTVAAGYETVLSDGPTSIVSRFDEHHRLTAREVRSSTASGEQVVQAQRMTYPERPDSMSAGGAQGEWNRPSTVEVVYTNESGRSRTESTSFVFDEYGRELERRDADGLVTKTTYDPTPEGRELPPVGLTVSVRTEAVDGLIAETRYQLDDERTQVDAVETWSNAGAEPEGGHTSEAESESAPEHPSSDGLVRTGRTEYVREADGFVTEQRVFPQGGAGEPVRTAFARAEDAEAGTVTVTETVAAGTPEAVTTSAVTDLASGQALAHADPVGNTAMVEYDELGREVARTDALNRTVHTEYLTAASDGVNAVAVTTPDRVTRTEERDVLGRVTRVTDNIEDGAAVAGHVRVSEVREYPDAATVVVTDAWGGQTTTREDVFGRVIETAAPTGATQVTAYDDLEQTSESGITVTGDLADAESVVRTRSDVRGAVVESSGWRADGVEVPAVQAVRDGFGRPVSSSDGQIETRVRLDAFGNPVTTTTTDTETPDVPLVESRELDAFGTSVEKVLSSGEAWRSGGRQRVDVLGRTVAETDQRGATSTVAYTPDGLVEREVSASGAVTEYRYHAKTRELLESVVSSPVGATVRTGFEYDEVTGALVAVFDPADRGGTQISTEYDAWGNATKVTYPDGKVIEHEYDGNGRRIATIDVALNRTEFSYDRAGLLAAAVQTDAGGDPVAEARYEYDELGRMVALDRGNGVRSEYEFTSVGQVAAEITTGPGGDILAERDYTYDVRGQLTSRTDTVHDDGADGTEPNVGAAPVTTTSSYEYDAHGRLLGSTVQSGEGDEAADASAPTRTDYELTVGGDIATERKTTAAGAVTREFEYSPTGELLAITTDGDRREQVYDQAGNLTLGADGTRYAYDAMDRQVQQTTAGGESITTRYWADGSRRDHTSGAAVTGFYWDGDTLINDTHTRDGQAWQTAGYLLGAERHARSLTGSSATPGGEVQYLLTDRHGNVTALTGADARTSATYEYTDYGVVTVTGRREASLRQAQDGAADLPAYALVGDASRQPFQYAGAYADPDGDLHLAIRGYDPDTARWRKRDPERLHNRYAYANLNPITLVDPTGRYAQPDAATGVLGGISLVLAAFSIGAAVVTGGASLAGIGAFGLTADIAGMVLSATLLANSASAKPFLPRNVREGFEIAEIALIPISIAGAIADGYRAYKATRPALAADDYVELDEIASPPSSARSEPEVVSDIELKPEVPVYTLKIIKPPLRRWGGPLPEPVKQAPVKVVPPAAHILQEQVFPQFHGLPLPDDLIEEIHFQTSAIRGLGYDLFYVRLLMQETPLGAHAMLRIGGTEPEWIMRRHTPGLELLVSTFVAGAKHIVKYADRGHPAAMKDEQWFNFIWQQQSSLRLMVGDIPTLRQVAAYR